MAARLSALRAGSTLLPGFFIFKDSWQEKSQCKGKVKRPYFEIDFDLTGRYIYTLV
jgi:hypothetical protein